MPHSKGCHVAERVGCGWASFQWFFYPWKLRWLGGKSPFLMGDRSTWMVSLSLLCWFSGMYSPKKKLSMMPRIEELALLTLWWDIVWSRRGVLTTTCEWCVEKDYSDISGNSWFISEDDYVTIYQPSTSPFNLITKCLMLFYSPSSHSCKILFQTSVVQIVLTRGVLNHPIARLQI